MDKKAIKAEIRKSIEDKIKASATRNVSVPSGNGSGNGEVPAFSFARLIKAMVTKSWEGAEYEKDIVEKAMRGDIATAGGYLIPEGVAADLIERLKAQAVVRLAGARVYTMTTATLPIPKIRTSGSTYWIGPDTVITASELSVGQVVLEAKKLASLVPLDNDLLNDSPQAVEDIVRQDIASELALAEDLAFLQGSGVMHQPTGILNTRGINTIAQAGAALTADDLADALTECEIDNARPNAWFMAPAVRNICRKLKDEQGRYIFATSPVLGEPPTIWGLPVWVTSQIPTNLGYGESYIICGQMNQAAIGDRKVLEFATSTEAGEAFEKDQTYLRVLSRVDFALRNPEAFCVLTGVM